MLWQVKTVLFLFCWQCVSRSNCSLTEMQTICWSAAVCVRHICIEGVSFRKQWLITIHFKDLLLSCLVHFLLRFSLVSSLWTGNTVCTALVEWKARQSLGGSGHLYSKVTHKKKKKKELITTTPPPSGNTVTALLQANCNTALDTLWYTSSQNSRDVHRRPLQKCDPARLCIRFYGIFVPSSRVKTINTNAWAVTADDPPTITTTTTRRA